MKRSQYRLGLFQFVSELFKFHNNIAVARNVDFCMLDVMQEEGEVLQIACLKILVEIFV